MPPEGRAGWLNNACTFLREGLFYLKHRHPVDLYRQAGEIGGGHMPSATVQTAGQYQRNLLRLHVTASNGIFDKAMAFRSQETLSIRRMTDVGLKNGPQFTKGYTEIPQFRWET